VPSRGRVPAAIDRALSDLARDPDASLPAVRNALFAAHWPLLSRICYRLWWRHAERGIVAREEVEHEAFIVFAALLQAWGRDGSFTAYLLGRFAWRLRDRIRMLNGTTPAQPIPRGLLDAVDDSYDTEMAVVLLEELLERRPLVEQRLVLGRVCHGKSMAQLAHELGITRRTATRLWNRLTTDLYRDLSRLTGDRP
jgi:RNA polymerase sigma factor (sigma-70 family)